MVAIGIGLLGLPVWSVTRNRDAPPVVTQPMAAGEPLEIDLLIESSFPCTVVVMNAAVEIVSLTLESSAENVRVQIPVEGTDLVVRADAGMADQRFAVRMQAMHDGSRLADSSFWGSGQLAGVMPIPPPEEAR